MTTDYQTRIIGFCEDQIFFRAVVFRMIAAMMQASNEPANVPSFAPFTGGAPSKASMAMNNDMVNPIPASHAYPSRDLQARPLGSFAIPDFTATNAAAVTPSGLPMISPAITPSPMAAC